MLNLYIECWDVLYCCDYGFDLTFQGMDQNHVKVWFVEFVVQIVIEVILQNCLKNLFYGMVTQQINNQYRYQTRNVTIVGFQPPSNNFILAMRSGILR